VAEAYEVSVSAGSLTTDTKDTWHLPHRWTREGVSVEAAFTGAHLLHVSVAGCVLNDLYREAEQLGVELAGARVSAEGGFDKGWNSTGIRYRVEVDSPAAPADVQALLSRVDKVAEVPKALRSGTTVTRVP
jgi:uncharacterized OsmC-like protein